MDLLEALDIVLDLASENALDPDNYSSVVNKKLKKKATKQHIAINMLKEFSTGIKSFAKRLIKIETE